MSKFLRFKNQIINIDEIRTVEWLSLPRDCISQESQGYKLTVFLKGGSYVEFRIMDRAESVRTFNEISEILEAVKV